MRTSYAALAGIIELDSAVVSDDATAEPFIAVANALVTECCVVNGPSVSYDDARLELIERWLAAHVYATRDPRAASESAGSVSASYQSSVAIGFDNSHYGQMAMRLDTNGGLSSLNERSKKGRGRLGVTWLGTATD